MGYEAVEAAASALAAGCAVLVETADAGVIVAGAGGPGAALVELHAAGISSLGPERLGADPAGLLGAGGDVAVATDLLRVAGHVPGGRVRYGRLGSIPRHVPLPSVLARFAEDHDVPLVSVDDLVHHRWRHEQLVDEVATARLPLAGGTFTAVAFRSRLSGIEHICLVLGDVRGREDVLCRVHSECVTGDVFGSLRCDCGQQLEASLAAIVAEGAGMVVYLRGHEGRGIGLAEKLRAYALQEQGHDTYDANVMLGHPPDGRSFGDAAQIIRAVGPASVRLLTNNPAKLSRLQAHGVTVAGRVPVEMPANEHNRAYLDAKRRRFGHLLEDLGADPAPPPADW